MKTADCTVVGASFAGLACATVLARAGLDVRVLEKKADAGEKLHTTGIIVKDAIDQVTLLDGLPAEIVRRVPGVRLYAPNLRYVDLAAPGYYFLTTDTPEVMRWLARKAEEAGAKVAYRASFRGVERSRSGFDLGEHGATRFLVGADGPNSAVATALGLGRSRQFLFGIEREYAGAQIAHPEMLHCFADRQLAPGYIGWVTAAPTGVQVGLAQRVRPGREPAARAIERFMDKIAPFFDFRDVQPSAVRAGLIPCGGTVSPVAAPRVLLVGDAAGMVSPVTAGGIHTALKHGLAAGHAIADYLGGKRGDPSGWFVQSYPKFRVKRLLRLAFDHFQSDTLFNFALRTKLLRTAAGIVYFHHKGVFDPATAESASRARPESARTR